MPSSKTAVPRRVSAAEAKRELLDHVRQGRTIAAALKVVGRSRSWYDTERRVDRDFADTMDMVRTRATDQAKENRGSGMTFAEFSERYLHQRVWPHSQNMVDLMEGREPSWLDPAMTYEPGTSGKSRILVNIPPNHAKSATMTVNYVTYLVVMNPNINILIVSKTQNLAKKFLYAIKQRLTHPRYADLQLAFGPPDGYKATAHSWTATQIYLGGDDVDSGEKDPTIEAIGYGSQIYGSRAHVIVLDDIVTLSNAGDWENQQDWIRQEVASRLPPDGGKLLCVGTRVAPIDLYRELRNPDHYTDGRVPWTYLAMPAVLQSSNDPADWRTLWPKSEMPLSEEDVPDENGLYERWSGPRLAVVRNEVGPSKWSLVYQNTDVPDSAIFDPVCINGSVNGMRRSGPLVGRAAGHPDHPEGFYRIVSMDPAMAGDTASLAYAVDRRTGKRYVMDVDVMTAPSPSAIRGLLQSWADRYKPHVVVVESNAFQLFLTKDEQIREFLASRGIAYRPHHTSSNKTDPDFGVASLAPLFGTKVGKAGTAGGYKHAEDNLIELPDKRDEGVKKLVEQLVTWQPGIKGTKLKQDTVMALWFAEIVAREVLFQVSDESNFMESEWTAERDRSERYVINLDEYMTSLAS